MTKANPLARSASSARACCRVDSVGPSTVACPDETRTIFRTPTSRAAWIAAMAWSANVSPAVFSTTVSASDAVKMVRAVLESTAQSPAPKRLPLDRDTYSQVHAALVSRLALLESQKELAEAMDVD